MLGQTLADGRGVGGKDDFIERILQPAVSAHLPITVPVAVLPHTQLALALILIRNQVKQLLSIHELNQCPDKRLGRCVDKHSPTTTLTGECSALLQQMKALPRKSEQIPLCWIPRTQVELRKSTHQCGNPYKENYNCKFVAQLITWGGGGTGQLYMVSRWTTSGQ